LNVGRRRCDMERCEILLKEWVDEAIAASYRLEQDTLGGLVEKTNGVPGHHACAGYMAHPSEKLVVF